MDRFTKVNSFGGDPELLQHFRDKIVLIKYGGNAMTVETFRDQVFDQLAVLRALEIHPVIVHGGGPVIKELLKVAGIESEFIGGHRKTDRTAMKYVEMALSGQINGDIVRGLNSRGLKAVGLSGKDGSMVTAERRYHEEEGSENGIDLGYVGNVVSVDTGLITTLLKNDYLPVIAPIGTGSDQKDYNINADMFAGHLAGALKAEAFVAMTDVDGLMQDIDRPDSLLETVTSEEIHAMMGTVIEGGMIPKAEACLIALQQGVRKAHIINGTKPDTLLNKLLTYRKSGTTIEA